MDPCIAIIGIAACFLTLYYKTGSLEFGRFIRRYSNKGRYPNMKIILVSFFRTEEEQEILKKFVSKIRTKILESFFTKENIIEKEHIEMEKADFNDTFSKIGSTKNDPNIILFTFVNQYERVSNELSHHLDELEGIMGNFKL